MGSPKPIHVASIFLAPPSDLRASCNLMSTTELTPSKTSSSQLLLLQDPQIEFCLLRSCLSLPEFTYTLRICKPRSLEVCYKHFDHIQQLSLENIVGCSMDETTWFQSTLPVSMGGMGLREASSHCTAAYLSSLMQTKALVDQILGDFPNRHSLDIPLAIFRVTAGSPALTSDDFASGNFTQMSLSLQIDTHRQKTILERASVSSNHRFMAGLRSVTLPHSGSWLNVWPSQSLGLSLLPQVFRIACHYRLVYADTNSPCPACGSNLDKFGDHTIICASEGERIMCHNVLRDAIYEKAVHAGCSPKKEQRALLENSR
jgi:hypothetical protein